MKATRMGLARGALLAAAAAAVLTGCGGEADADADKKPAPGPGQAKQPDEKRDFLAAAGKTPQATLRAYYHYKDRGLNTRLRALVDSEFAKKLPDKDGGGYSTRAQKLRGLVIDHEVVAEKQATIYYRTWFSAGTKARGGRVSAARLVKEGGAWKVDVMTTLKLTMGITKGKSKYGFYDGTKKWWE